MSTFRPYQSSLFDFAAPTIWPVWGGSTTAPVEFRPLPKRRAGKLYQKARAHDRRRGAPHNITKKKAKTCWGVWCGVDKQTF
jgi:hypothetical protein